MDEVMSDPAQPFAGSQDQDNSQKTASWNTKKFREEFEAAKARLADQKFDIGECDHKPVVWWCLRLTSPLSFTLARYADPLMPREPHAVQSSQSFSLEAEKRLQDLVSQIKGSNGTTS